MKRNISGKGNGWFTRIKTEAAYYKKESGAIRFSIEEAKKKNCTEARYARIDEILFFCRWSFLWRRYSTTRSKINRHWGEVRKWSNLMVIESNEKRLNDWSSTAGSSWTPASNTRSLIKRHPKGYVDYYYSNQSRFGFVEFLHPIKLSGQ